MVLVENIRLLVNGHHHSLHDMSSFNMASISWWLKIWHNLVQVKIFKMWNPPNPTNIVSHGVELLKVIGLHKFHVITLFPGSSEESHKR